MELFLKLQLNRFRILSSCKESKCFFVVLETSFQLCHIDIYVNDDADDETNGIGGNQNQFRHFQPIYGPICQMSNCQCCRSTQYNLTVPYKTELRLFVRVFSRKLIDFSRFYT